MRFPLLFSTLSGTLRYAVLPVAILSGIVVFGISFFVHGRLIMAEELQDRLRMTAALAVRHIDPSLITSLRTYSDIKRPQYRALVAELDAIRSNVPHIRFAYILRPTGDAITMDFVADADGLKTPEQLDSNRNGVVDPDEEPGHPGDPYDIREIPALQGITGPRVDEDVTTDQWGTFMSGYAPIRDARGTVVGVLGLDMDAENFVRISQSFFSPVALLLVTCAGMLLAAYAVLVFRKHRLETLQQLEADRSALMDLATHQLGVPLATFRWWVEILRDQNRKKNDDAISQLEEGISRMDHIIESLRTAAHMQNRHADDRAVRISVKKIIALIPESTFLLIKRRRQKLVLSVSPKLRITIDPKIFSGVLQEILENASYYSPERKTITIRARQARRHVTISVEDQGYGIDAKDLPHIFEQFSRGSKSMLYKPVGNGLGLFIAKNVITRAGGSIHVQSTVGTGTTVTITLPAAP